MKRTRIVVVSDMHVGSIYGLAPLKFTSQDHRDQSPFLSWVYEKWSEFCKEYNSPDYLLLLGDLADGPQVKDLGVDAISTSVNVQVEMAKTLLKELIGERTKVFGINGSGYHGGKGLGVMIDKLIVEAIRGEYVGNAWECDIGQERIQIAHACNGSYRNPTTGVLSEIKLSKEDAQKRKDRNPTIIIRGHLHRAFSVQDDAGVWGILNGCWQYVTPFMATKTSNITPSIGATIIDIEDGIAKVYRKDYLIPNEVRQGMIRATELQEIRVKGNKERERKIRIKVLKRGD